MPIVPTEDNEFEKPVFAHPDQQRGPIQIKEWRERIEDPLRGQILQIVEMEVDAFFGPDFAPIYGILQQTVQNERNSRRSRFSYTYLNVGDLFEPLTKTGWEDQGAQGVTRKIRILDATAGLPTPPSETLLLLSAQVSHYDRAHAIEETVTATSFQPLELTVREDPEAGGLRSIVTKQVVAPGTTIPTGATIISAQLDEQTLEKALLTTKSAPDGFGVISLRDQLDGDGFGKNVVATQQIKETSYSPPAPTYLTIDSTLKQLGNGKALYVRKDIDAWPVMLDEDEEPETGLEITIERQIVPVATAPSHGTARIVRTLKQIDSVKSLLTIRTIAASVLTDIFYEYHNVRYYFPAYLDGDNPFSIIEALDGQSLIGSNRSSDHTFSLPCKFEITYHSTVPTVSEVFQFKPIDLNIVTPVFSVRENDILCDSGTLHFYSPSTGDFDYYIPGSSPTTTEFFDLMGDEVLIADDVSRWKFNLWKRIKVFMTIPDLSQGLGGYLS